MELLVVMIFIAEPIEKAKIAKRFGFMYLRIILILYVSKAVKCKANQWTGFNMMATLAFNELKRHLEFYIIVSIFKY